MLVKIVKSGSDGNCAILEDVGNRQIILDCGLTYSEIIKNCDLEDVSLVCVSHFHKDHTRSLKDFQKFYIPTYTWEDADKGILFDTPYWKILPIPLVHNAKCFGFLVFSKTEKKKIAYITDTTVIPKLGDIDCLIIDTNYDEEIVEQKLADGMPINLGYRNHLSNQQVAGWLKERNKKIPVLVPYHISNSKLNELDKIKDLLSPYAEKLIISAPNTSFNV